MYSQWKVLSHVVAASVHGHQLVFRHDSQLGQMPVPAKARCVINHKVLKLRSNSIFCPQPKSLIYTN